jgi:hypothetical protein
MTPLALIDVIGFWIGIFLTLCILSFLYKDNPFYKLAEHLFVGVSLGYVIVQQFNDNLWPKLVQSFSAEMDSPWDIIKIVIPLILVLMMFTKILSRRHAWVGRFPLAFVVALFAGLQINAVVQSELGEQMKFAARSLDSTKVDLNTATPDELKALPGVTPALADRLIIEREKAPFTSIDDAVNRPGLTPMMRKDLEDQRGGLVGLDAKADVAPAQRNWFGVVSNVLLLLGLLSSLLYFYFSIAHKGAVGRVSRFGVWVLMIGFGASFGFTVQGRIALAIGRAQDIRGTFALPDDASQIQGEIVAGISALIIIVGIVFWELRQKRRDADHKRGGAPPTAAAH